MRTDKVRFDFAIGLAEMEASSIQYDSDARVILFVADVDEFAFEEWTISDGFVRVRLDSASMCGNTVWCSLDGR